MRVLQLLSFSIALAVASSSAMAADFFPTRPIHATLKTVVGTLTSLNIGMTTGELIITNSSGSTSLFVGHPLKINGIVNITCPIPPVGTNTPNPLGCPGGWPKQVVVGRSKVSVTYWTGVYNGEPVKITDQIDSSR